MKQDQHTLCSLTGYECPLPRLVGFQRTTKQVRMPRHSILQRQARALAIPRREVLLPKIVPATGVLIGRHAFELLFETLAVFGGEFINHVGLDVVLEDNGSCGGIGQL